jgi:membrane protease YdiL (CAAX protease family)
MTILATPLPRTDTDPDAGIGKLSLPATVFLHLFPGAVTVTAYLALVPMGLRHGVPPLLIGSALFILLTTPLELGHLLLLGRRATGRWSLSPAVVLPRPMQAWRYAALVLGVVVATVVLYALAAPANAWFDRHFMGWLPSWFDYSKMTSYAGFSRGMLLATLAMRFAADVVVTPAAEELYFRGYLMPRIPASGWRVPLTSALLFALYHFWQPYNLPEIFVFTLPMILAAWRFKDVRISIFAHTALNLIGLATFAVAILR